MRFGHLVHAQYIYRVSPLHIPTSHQKKEKIYIIHKVKEQT